MQMADSLYLAYKQKVDEFLKSKATNSELSKLIEDIKSAAFMNEITQEEADYLIDLLPVGRSDDIDEYVPPQRIGRDTGGISVNEKNNDIEDNKFSYDELDDFDDFDNDEDEEENSGFLGFLK